MAADYTKPDVSLTSLGFNYSEKDALCTYEKDGYSIALYKPEWGQREEKMETSRSSPRRTAIISLSGISTASKGIPSRSTRAARSPSTNTLRRKKRYDEGYPDKETVQKLFQKVFGDSEEYQYSMAIDRFNKYFTDTFGMTADKLYALPLE